MTEPLQPPTAPKSAPEPEATGSPLKPLLWIAIPLIAVVILEVIHMGS